MVVLILILLGVTFGSFLNVVVDRLYKNESFVKGRSHCESCKKELKWNDLIPIASFLFLSGKCRYCKKKLSFYYPVIEITTAFIFIATFNFVSNTYSPFIFPYSLGILVYHLSIACLLIIIFFSDLKYGIIPNKITLLLVSVTFFYLFCTNLSNGGAYVPYIVSAFSSFLFFFLIVFVTKGKGMGLGDVKFVFFMGLFLGYPKIIFALYAAFLTGALFSLILILRGKKKLRGSTIPFGPFLVLGTLISLWYIDFFVKLFPYLGY